MSHSPGSASALPFEQRSVEIDAHQAAIASTSLSTPTGAFALHQRSSTNTDSAGQPLSSLPNAPPSPSARSSGHHAGRSEHTMMSMPMLSVRRKRDSGLLSKPPPSSSTFGRARRSSHSTTASLRNSLKTPSSAQRNIGLIIIIAVCFIVYLIPTSTQRDALADDEEGAPPVPYTVQKSYLRKGTGWVKDQARVIGDKIPVPFHDARIPSISNSPPHPKQQYPDFQSAMYKLTANDWPEYERKLVEFSKSAFPKSVADWAISSLKARSPARRHSGEVKKPKGIPPFIWQTGKDLPTQRNSFQEQNPKASYFFYDDALLESWAMKHFGGSLVKRIWDGMERVVLKADFWRYLVVYLEGGYYSDTDTDCLKPLERWGTADAVTWDLGDLVSKEVAYGPPQVVVGIEVDVPDATGWETFWPRPIQIVQWTMSGTSGHPIYLDSIRRVVESMNIVKEWDAERKAQAAELLSKLTNEQATLKDRKKFMDDAELWGQLRDLLTVDPFDKERGGKMSLIEATGPGAFSDAVFSYLQARYGLHWSQLHNIQTATRIGEVAILPITGFAPFYKPDYQRWKGLYRGAMAVVGDVTHPQAMVNHQFSGSWRKASDNSA